MTGYDSKLRFRLTVLGLIMLSLFSVLLSRLWFLQVLAGDRFAEAATRNRVRIVRIEAPRGRILDRGGKVLVGNRPSLSVAIRRDDLPSDPAALTDLKRRLSRLLAMPVAGIERRLRDPRTSHYTPVVIKEDAPPDAVFAVRERQEEYPGVESLVLPVRTYPQGTLASQALGYVAEISQSELERLQPQGYRLGDSIGKTGIERSYERWLRGRPGEDKLEVDATGRVLRSLGSRDPVPGADLTLSIDAGVQRVAEEALQLGILRARARRFHETGERFRAPAGGTVVLDPATGEVIAMASVPGFDPRRFVGGVDASYLGLLNDPESHSPFLNRALQAAYPPGSTIKPFVALAALGTGVADPAGHYPCTTSFHFGDREFRNWRSREASITVGQALVESCDTVFYQFGSEWWKAERRLEKAGRRVPDTLQEWARRFGFGSPTGIDLPQEGDGYIPTRAARRAFWEKHRAEWCARFQRTRAVEDEDLCLRGWLWRGGDAVNLSIGQGELVVTPLQLAGAYAALANGGRLLEPHVGLRIAAPDGSSRRIAPKVRRTLPLSADGARYVRSALARVPVAGTAAFPFRGWPFDRIGVAAKTGSAEIAGKQPFSWFVSYAPANDPKYVAVSVVEEAGFGSQVSGPVVRRIMDRLFDRPLTPVEYGARSD